MFRFEDFSWKKEGINSPIEICVFTETGRIVGEVIFSGEYGASYIGRPFDLEVHSFITKEDAKKYVMAMIIREELDA